VTTTVRDPAYVNRHKSQPTAFTRIRKLSFLVIFILILRNSVKSIQLVLNEFTLDAAMKFSITAGAFCRARKKLLHTAYVELNNDIIGIYYRDDDIKRYKGYRILGFDGSKIILPNTKEVKEAFGEIRIKNQTDKELGDYPLATYEACYDVLNNIAVESSLNAGKAYECNLAGAMIDRIKGDDLCLFDRGYASYSFMALLLQKEKHFIIRCPQSFLPATNEMFDKGAPETRIVRIDVPRNQEKKVKESELAVSIRIKLVKIILSTGETEVLATSLLDECIGIEEYKYLYGKRWGVETFFSKLKGRLCLENFTGKTVESVKQDFWSTVFISNLETIMTEKVEEEMNVDKSKEAKKVKVNKAVSFNAIKKMAFDIFFSKQDKVEVIKRLDDLFRMNPVLIRENRKVSRTKIPITHSLNFQKRIRKHVF
jgi:hypothetical protein